MQCYNCGREIVEKFCPNCGQRAGVKRITLKEGWTDFWSRVYGFDGMFPRTLKDLTFRPGVAAREYIEGNRVKHYGPVGYFFLMVTLYLLVLSMLGFDIFDFMKGTQSSFQPEGGNTKLAQGIQRQIADNIKLFVFLIIPFQAFSARYLFFRKSGYNFLENSVLPFYVAGHLNWISIFMAISFKITGLAIFGPAGGGSLFVVIVMVISITYFAYAYSTFITTQSRLKAFIKGIGTYLASYLLFIIFVSIVAIIGVILISYIDPEAFDSIRPSKNR